MPFIFERELSLSVGRPLPLGVSPMAGGKNFALFSASATSVTLAIRIGEEIAKFELDPQKNKMGDIWHIKIKGLPDSFDYCYYVDGPRQWPHAFNSTKPILDPYCLALSGLEQWGVPKGEIWSHYRTSEFDWQGDQPLGRWQEPTIIYELHVRAFTKDPSSHVAHPGTFRGIQEKIPYLKSLGVTAVELLPIHDFDEMDCPFVNPITGEKLKNLWGYNAINFFSLNCAYASQAGDDKGATEFKELVQALHREGIEVILDVVFNHTAEGGLAGPTYNFKGLENSTYYILGPEGYSNFSGCGNTLNCNHPAVRMMILDALCHFVNEFHVDGFRFDLASILSRDDQGRVLPYPPLIEAIAKHPLLSKTRIIAEAWDAAGLYQVGSFPAAGGRWSEWNGKFRDATRRFLLGDPDVKPELATRLAGSEDLYGKKRSPVHSVNFITSHDGFTMMDLVSYQAKHNLANGEQNRDGESFNHSQNFGVEGPTIDPKIQAQRLQQIRNMAALLLLSHGTPMMLAGDEFGNSQQGNNNGWCQDNPTSWLNWGELTKNWELFVFWQRMIAFRKAHPSLTRKGFFSGAINPASGIPDLSWHGQKPFEPEFDHPGARLAFLLDGMRGEQILDDAIFVAMNFNAQEECFELPSFRTMQPWKRVLDTAEPGFFLEGKSLPAEKGQLMVRPFSIQVATRAYR